MLKYGVKRFLILLGIIGFTAGEPVRIGLVLSGGAALGLAHIGVLKVLEREGLDFVGITGNSMGSLVGGVYAAGYSATEIESIALNADWERLFSSQPAFGAQYLPEKQQAQRYVLRFRHRRFVPFLPAGLVPLQNVELLLNRLLAEVEFNSGYDFDSLVIPYRAVAVDVGKGELVILRSGRLEQAIRASIAIPGVFSPEVIDGRELVDGGVLEYLPVEAIREFQPDFIIAVLTMRQLETPGRSLVDFVSRSIDLMGIRGVERAKGMADVVIEPDVSGFLHSDFARVKELIAAGESAAVRALPLIRERLKGRVPVKVRRDIKPRVLPVVQEIRFEGLKRTRRSLLLTYVRTTVDGFLNFGVLLDDLERLFNTGFFEDVNFRLEFVADNRVVVVFDLTERPFGFYSIGVRYDNYDNVVVGGEVGDENIMGSGAAVRVAGILGNPNELRFGLTGTRIFWIPFGYRVDGYLTSLNRTLWREGRFYSSYLVRIAGTVAEAGYITGRHGFFNLGAIVERTEYVGAEVDTLNTENIAGLLFNMEFNNQDRLDLPGKGIAYRLNGLYSSSRLWSALDFLKLNFTGEQVVRIFPQVSIRLWGDAGYSFGNLPFVEYFLTGGERFLGLAPEEFVTTQRVVLGSALRLRLFRMLDQDDYPVYLEVGGNLGTFSRLERLVADGVSLDDVHWGAGVGVMTNTPLGPLRFWVALGNFLKRTPHPGGVRFYLSLGKDFRYRR